MTASTITEKRAILRLVKDFTHEYNPSSLGKVIGITRVGTFKALRELEKKGIVNGKNYGKARYYTVDLSDDYARKNAEILLMEQSRAYQRWVDEFEGLSEYAEIIVLFGSMLRDEHKASDVDVLLVYDAKNNKRINEIIREKDEMLAKRIHPVKQTKEDLISNIKKKDEVVLSAIRDGVVIYGFEELLRVIRDVTCKE
ncbi:MAG: nucleotidyltransferase domain-containing protein [archaeon]